MPDARTDALVLTLLRTRPAGMDRDELARIVTFIENNEAVFEMIRRGEFAVYWDADSNDLRLGIAR